jgi:hypothetical protein
MARGQSNIFGAIEEKGDEDFSRNFTGQVEAQWCAVAVGSGAVSVFCERWERNLVEWAAGMSTGRAQEMQKAVVTPETSVLIAST